MRWRERKRNHMTDKKIRIGLIPGLTGESLERDWDGTLDRLAAMGYEGLEVSAGALAKSGMSAEDCRKSLAGHGFEAMSWFAGWGDFDKNAEEHIANAAALGCSYMVWGWAPPQEEETMKEVLPVMHKAASMVRSAGMTLVYHNHDHEFLNMRGDQTAFDWLMDQFAPDLLQCELDVGWVGFGKQDVRATIKKHRNRCPLLHMRDIEDIDTRGAFIEVGEGILDLKSILTYAAAEANTSWAIVEHPKQMKRDGFDGMQLAAQNITDIINNIC